ncbi:MAG: flagellar export chaperone FlgN [Burkholderiales bacterium]|uniref:Flagellar protein FlgN n=1 Tax=Janthinobacterium tructae TaxID=2590869 RepID=A0A4Y6R8F1_9BURK|nr:flagellar export chaperone FlgN [Janthinobacterium tructae]MBH1985004.1 flagellar export chaperone FlgN [Burkholderiales bacterium]MBH1996584.1 flagellar export chaperone FlgN [Burkholderiales bacterium]MBH2068163.1 flagellar export chaperone FlgN [Burkholderiales bacterium]QDG69261.1 flagellar protein FlgN [Janthinobacterium tructae]
MTAARKGITRQEAVRRVLQGMTDDSVGYAALQTLLEEQFQATLQHQSTRLTALADQVIAAVEPLDARRRQRVSLVTALLGPQGDMPQLFALLQEDARSKAEADWVALEQMVLECKRLNARNSDLLTEQYSIMQRVLHGEEDTYAPG